MSDETGSDLSRQQFDSVIRRAAELATGDLDAKEGRVSEVELFRIASEVGLRETDVRRALMEVRSSGGGTTLDRIFGFETVTASRVVSDARVNLKDRLDDFLVARSYFALCAGPLTSSSTSRLSIGFLGSLEQRV